MSWSRDELSQAAALEVLLHGPLTRAELAGNLGVAPATVTRISADLIADGILAESGVPVRGKAGRPGIPLDVVVDAQHFLGAKLTADSLSFVVTDLRAGVVREGVHPLPKRTPETVGAILARIVAQGDEGIAAVGICLGAVVTSGGGVATAPFLDWVDVPLASVVEAVVGVPVFIENDVLAFTEAEHWFGEGAGCTSFATVTVGVATGYGCVANGRLLANQDSGVGLVGHWPLEGSGPICSQGHRGCAESMLSTSMLSRQLSVALGRRVTWEEVVALAAAGQPAAKALIREAAAGLGKLIAAIANLTAPERVVIGGEGVELARLGWDELADGIAAHRDPRASRVEVRITSGGNREWCRGAAVVAIQGFIGRRQGKGSHPVRMRSCGQRAHAGGGVEQMT